MERVTRSKDGVVKSVVVQVLQPCESEARFTTRAVRSLVKLFNVDDVGFQEEMGELERLSFDLRQEKPVPEQVKPLRLARRTGEKVFKIVNKACSALYNLSMSDYESSKIEDITSDSQNVEMAEQMYLTGQDQVFAMLTTL